MARYCAISISLTLKQPTFEIAVHVCVSVSACARVDRRHAALDGRPAGRRSAAQWYDAAYPGQWMATAGSAIFIGHGVRRSRRPCGRCAGLPRSCSSTSRATTLFFGWLIVEVSRGCEGKPIVGDARTLMMQWLPVTDPLGIAEDPECGYGQPVRFVS
jgi:hypothetical protein